MTRNHTCLQDGDSPVARMVCPACIDERLAREEKAWMRANPRPTFWRNQWPVVLIAAVWLAINLLSLLKEKP